MAAPAAACQLERVALVRLTLAQGFPLVPVQAAGRDWMFLVDTGAQDNLVTPEAAAAMGLPSAPGPRTRVIGVDGRTTMAGNVVLRGLRMGDAAVPARIVPAATLPGLDTIDPPVAGILGVPFLSAFDILMDGPGRRFALYAVQGCGAVPVPLPPPFVQTPLRRSPTGELLVQVQADGRALDAVLDTGARGTVLADPARAAPGRTRLREFRVGTDLVRDMDVSVSPGPVAGWQALLGMDYLAPRRVWISYASLRLAVQHVAAPR